jgi:putative ABC transport system permease protein
MKWADSFKWTLRSLRSGWVSGALAACVLALGVGVTTTATSVLRVLSNDPIPGRAHQLFYVQLDARSNDAGADASAAAPQELTWTDAMTVMHDRPELSAAMVGGMVPVSSGGTPGAMLKARFTTHGFFRLFDVPMRSGHAWSAASDSAHAREAVLSTGLARKLFGDVDPVGRPIVVQGKTFSVVGVAGHWQPRPRFYDLSQGGFQAEEDIYLPLETAVELKLPVVTGMECWGDGFSMLGNMKTATCSWLKLWTYLPDKAAVNAYRAYLVAYSDMQRRSGRFERPTWVGLADVMDHLEQAGLVTPMVSLQTYLAFGLLIACVVNAAAVLLVRTLRRRSEVSLRRALGATKGDIRMQLLHESLLIGLVAAAGGSFLGYMGVCLVNLQATDYAAAVHLDRMGILMASVVAITSSVIAGMAPTWAVMRIQPATFLKAI